MVQFSKFSKRNHVSLCGSRIVPVLLLVVIGLQCMIIYDNNYGASSYSYIRTVDEVTQQATTISTTSKSPEIEATTTTSVVRDMAVQAKDFFPIASKYGTDKVLGKVNLEACLKDPKVCHMPDAVKPECRPWGHYYHTLYNRWLGPLANAQAEPFQLMEIGFYTGKGYDSYVEFLPQAEAHSIEFFCRGDKVDGKWPVNNSASQNSNYQELRDKERLHCGDASNFDFLNSVWTDKMRRPGAPPLKVVIDDGSHLSRHMAASLFFWFPRIEPRGLFVVEDIQPIPIANEFRTQVLPQVLKDLHYCGEPQLPNDKACFPTIQPLLASVHCEMHICVFERNDEPAIPDLSKEQSSLHPHALDSKHCFET